jgi:hypothetical protein
MIVEGVQLASLIARSEKPGDYRILDERLRDEPYGFMLRKNDPQFKALVDETLTKAMKSGEIQELYAKWFTRPVPPAAWPSSTPTPSPTPWISSDCPAPPSACVRCGTAPRSSAEPRRSCSAPRPAPRRPST